MENIIHAFGIDGRLIVIQIFNFALLLAALWYFLYTPILKILNEREEKIKKGMEDARVAEATRAQAEDEKNSVLSAAHKEAENIAGRAKSHAETQSADIVAAAHTKAQGVIESADAQAEEIKHKARKESDEEIAKTAVLAAEKILKENA